MLWIAPSEKDTDNAVLEKRLREAADQFRVTESYDIRTLAFGLPKVRYMQSVIRHCPDPHNATGRFDFVLANPPFNVNAVDEERSRDVAGPGRRFPFGLPRTDNAAATRACAKTKLATPDRRSVGESELHSLWIQLFHSALNDHYHFQN